MLSVQIELYSDVEGEDERVEWEQGTTIQIAIAAIKPASFIPLSACLYVEILQ